MDRVKKDAPSSEGKEVVLGRRAALKKLGLLGLAVYAAPTFTNLNDAEAASRSRSRSGNKKRRRKGRKGRKGRSRSRSRTRSRSRSRG